MEIWLYTPVNYDPRSLHMMHSLTSIIHMWVLWFGARAVMGVISYTRFTGLDMR